jgi:cobalt-zinc-cadmium resistance protein CzcA
MPLEWSYLSVIDRIIDMSLRQRFLLILLTLGLIGYGIYATSQLNVDAFPDVTNIQVTISTAAPGLAAEQVEKLVTFPIELAMGGLPDSTEVRSLSKTSLSQITVVFQDSVDIYFARQLVQQRLLEVRDRLPKGLGDPEMDPISTALGQVFMYRLVGDKDQSLMELRSLNDWFIKLQLRTVPGVADVLSFGGEVRQYQVNVDPHRLVKYGLTLHDVSQAIQANNTNAGGWYIEGQQEQLVVRGEGLLHGGAEGLDDLRAVVVKTVEGTPVYIRDVARVAFGPEIRQGAVTMNGQGETVMAIVLQLRGANTKKVIERIKAKIAAIQPSLPPGVSIEPIYDQAVLVTKAVSTVTEALIEASGLILVVLFLLLWNLRSALVVISAIPLSMLIAFIMMRWFGFSANLQSLGGLAIGIGMMVDGSVVMVENILRHLAEPSERGESLVNRVVIAAREVGQPIFFAVLIIVVVFLPLFTLQGIEGKLFSPMAFTIAFAMLGSLMASLTLVPVLASLLFRGRIRESDHFLMRFLKGGYRPVVTWAVRHRWIVVGASVIALAGALALVPTLGTEFVPELNEGAMDVRVTMNPSVSLSEAKRVATALERKLLKYPEVKSVFSQIGRAELGGEPEAISNNEIIINLAPQSEWTTAASREALIRHFNEDLNAYPGILLNISQPIALRVDELLSGVKAQIAVNLFGEDLDVLRSRGAQIQQVMASVPGASEVQMEQISGEAQLVIQAKRDVLARYGLNAQDVMDLVANGIGGEAVTQVIDGLRRFDVYLRIADAYRSDARRIGDLLVANNEGVRVPLARVADFKTVESPPLISHESGQRRVVIQCNVRGRDMGGFVADAQRAVRQQVSLPPGYFVTWGGEFENQQRAQATLSVVVPIALGLIFLLLFMSFGSIRNALLIILNVPFALIGGIIALALSGQYLSVPSSVGFIALFGVAVLNGVVLVSYINQLRADGRPVDDAAVEGAMLRLRPVLTTATVASLGLIPLLLSTGIGSEVQRPLATVVVGGLVSSTVLTLIVLPALYKWFASRH